MSRMSKLYPCPCCGYLTLEEAPPGTYQICPVCFWEDAKSFYEWGTNNCTLIDAQRNYSKYSRWGACEKEWRDSVRPPLEHEQRLPNWKTLEENYPVFKQRVIQSIYRAFDGVELEDGITLVEGSLIDDWMFSKSRKKEDKNERLQQQKEHNNWMPKNFKDLSLENSLENWQDIDDKLIEYYYDVLSFLDEKGYRFYLPAYMIWTIDIYDKMRTMKFDDFLKINTNSIGSTIFSLIPSEFNLSRRQMFTEEQSQAICQFLRFLAIYFLEVVGDDAIEALEYWQQFCQPLGNEVIYRCYPKNYFSV